MRNPSFHCRIWGRCPCKGRWRSPLTIGVFGTWAQEDYARSRTMILENAKLLKRIMTRISERSPPILIREASVARRAFFASSRTKADSLSLMPLGDTSNVQLLELLRQLVPFVTMK